VGRRLAKGHIQAVYKGHGWAVVPLLLFRG